MPFCVELAKVFRTAATSSSDVTSAIEKNPNRPEYLLTRNGVGYYLRLPDGA